jgi:hypothetical protein
MFLSANSSVDSSEDTVLDDLILKLPASAVKKGPFQGRGDFYEIVYVDKVNNDKL